MGHLIRTRVLLNTLAINDRVVLISASPFAGDPRVTGTLEVLEPPRASVHGPKTYHNWLRERLDEYQPDALFIDAFPAGVLGEWCDFPFPKDLELFHVARLLNWPAYLERIKDQPPRFSATYLVETVTDEHSVFLHAFSRKVIPTTLTYPEVEISPHHASKLENLYRNGYETWLVTHSGPEEEVQELLAYARDRGESEGRNARIVLVVPHPPQGLSPTFTYLDANPVSALFPLVDRIITACGFNLMQETIPFRDRHYWLPFPRPLDDQFLRAARHGNGKPPHQ